MIIIYHITHSMITFILDNNKSTPALSQTTEIISNGSGIDNQDFPRNIISHAIDRNTMEYCIENSTFDTEIKSFNDVDFSADTTFIYPIMAAGILDIFGITYMKDKNIKPVFEYIHDDILSKVRKKEIYIAIMAICEGRGYDDKQGWRDVKKVCKKYKIPLSQILIVLCGNHGNYKLQLPYGFGNYLHLNYYALELSRKIQTGYTNILKNIKNKKEKHYICLNSQIKPHRYHLVSRLYHNNLLQHGHVSCQSYESHVDSYPQVKNELAMREQLKKDGACPAEFIQFYVTLPYNVDKIDKDNYLDRLHAPWRVDDYLMTRNKDTIKDIVSEQIDNAYNSAVIDVVAETALMGQCPGKDRFYEININFITEKTFKAIMYKMPFIISGDKGNNKELLRHGFKLYDMLFDYTFDDYDSYVDRNNAIIEQLKKYCDMPLEDFIKLVETDEVQKVVEHNYNTLKQNIMWCNFVNNLTLWLDESRKKKNIIYKIKYNLKCLENWVGTILNGIRFKRSHTINRGDVVLLEDGEAVVKRVGLTRTKFWRTEDGVGVWHFVSNERLMQLKIEKINK